MTNRELDAWIAEHVMGLKNVRDNGIGSKFHGPPSSEIGLPAVVPHYSTDIAAAWEVVEKMGGAKLSYGKQTCIAEISRIGEDGRLLRYEVYVEEGDNVAPRAICLAAKKALEGK